MRYLDADTIREACEAYRNGIPLDKIAGHLRISVAELRHALGLPALKRETPRSDPEAGCDLWRADELNGVL